MAARRVGQEGKVHGCALLTAKLTNLPPCSLALRLCQLRLQLSTWSSSKRTAPGSSATSWIQARCAAAAPLGMLRRPPPAAAHAAQPFPPSHYLARCLPCPSGPAAPDPLEPRAQLACPQHASSVQASVIGAGSRFFSSSRCAPCLRCMLACSAGLARKRAQRARSFLARYPCAALFGERLRASGFSRPLPPARQPY